MSTITLSRIADKHPDRFRIKYDDAVKVLGPNAKVPENNSLPTLRSSLKLACIGTGFSGISLALTLQNDMGLDDYVLIDRHKEIGGTWHANVYPGVSLDVPLLHYLISNYLVTNWLVAQAPQGETQEYLLEVVNSNDIRRHCLLGYFVTKAEWNEDHWDIYLRNMDLGQLTIHLAKILVNGAGGLVYPNEYNPPGLDNFKGDYIHSAVYNWDVPIEGRNVIVVGNGCLAVQLVPKVLQDMNPKTLTQVVRLEHWIMPPVPHQLHKLYTRMSKFGYFGLWLVRNFVAILSDLRFPMFKGNSWLSRKIREFTYKKTHTYMVNTCPKKYQDILIPNFKVGCKRLIYDRGYLQALHDPRVDVKKSTIAQVKEHLVVLADGTELPADVIIACTGYNIGKNLKQIDVIGENGVHVNDLWDKEGVSAYETMMVKHCPNYFMLVGPNAGTGHFSVTTAIENACIFVKKMSKPILEDGVNIRVKPEKHDEWQETVQSELKKCVFGNVEFGGCKSWYTKDGHNLTAYPWSQYEFYKRMCNPKMEDMIIEKDCELCGKPKLD